MCGNSFHMTTKLRLRIQRVNQCHFLLQHAFMCVCVCVHVSIEIPHKFMRHVMVFFALFASFVVSHFQVFPYQSMHRLLIISRRHSCKIFVRISSQVQSMRIGSTKCGAHTLAYFCVCVFFFIISKSLLDCCYLKFYWKVQLDFVHFPFSISILFSLTSQAVESIEQYSHSEYVEEHTTKVVKQTTTQVSMVKKVKGRK